MDHTPPPTANARQADRPTAAPWSWHATVAIVAASLAGWVYAVVLYWSDGTELVDRVLILAGSGWTLSRMWPRLVSMPAKPIVGLGIALLIPAILLYPPNWFVFCQVGPRPIILWSLYAGAMLAVAGLTLIRGSLAQLNAARFPLLILILAMPLPGRIYNPIQQQLQQATTSTAVVGFKIAQVEHQRDGFVIRLKSGDLGVVEACSGIKSVTALTAIAAFLAHLKGFSLLRGTILLILNVPVIIAVNALRVVITGLLQEYVGKDAILGWKHDALGYAMLFLGLSLCLGLVRLMGGRTKEAEFVPSDPVVPSSVVPARGAFVACAILSLGAIATLYGHFQPSLARPAITDGEAPLDQIPYRIGEWTGSDLPVNPEILEKLTCNKAINREYSNRFGYSAQVWVIHWSTAKSVKGYHHPDICLPSQGFEVVSKGQLDLATPGGRQFPLTFREFDGRNGKLLVGYWTQEGRMVWSEEDERMAFHMTFPYQWLARRAGSRPATETDDRLVCWIFVRQFADTATTKKHLLEFTQGLADELYRVCPWADLKPTP